jgi:hypothetical protein
VALIDSNDYEWIRKRVDASLTEAAFPPNLIETYLEEAEDWVASRVVVGDLSDAQLAHAQRAAKYYVGSLIAPTVSIPTSDAVSGIGASYTRQVMKPADNAARLLQRAIEEIEQAASADAKPTTVMPTFFVAAPGGRGQ